MGGEERAGITTPATSVKDVQQAASLGKPVVVILHGINNSAAFGYMRALMRACAEKGWIGVGMNFRGCCDVPLATPRGYTGAYTGDLRSLVRALSPRLSSGTPMFLVGNSLGANIMTKYIGEEGQQNTLPKCVAGAVSLGNPLRIHSKDIGFPMGALLALGVKKTYVTSLKSFLPMARSPTFKQALRNVFLSTSIGDLDNAIAHHQIRNNPHPPFETSIGYDDGETYWKDASSYRYVGDVKIPLLMLTSEDDFLVHKGSHGKIGYCAANPNILIVNTRCGGHLGWHESPPDSKGVFGVGKSWADTATTDFFEAILTRKQDKPSRMLSPEHKMDLQAKALQNATAIRSRL